MQRNVGNHIKSLNWAYKIQLREKGVEYHNAYASFVDAHTIKLTEANGNTNTITAD
jgi:thioredoxin reductase (NADPH)